MTKHVADDRMLGKIAKKTWELQRRTMEGSLDAEKVIGGLQLLIEGSKSSKQYFLNWNLLVLFDVEVAKTIVATFLLQPQLLHQYCRTTEGMSLLLDQVLSFCELKMRLPASLMDFMARLITAQCWLHSDPTNIKPWTEWHFVISGFEIPIPMYQFGQEHSHPVPKTIGDQLECNDGYFPPEYLLNKHRVIWDEEEYVVVGGTVGSYGFSKSKDHDHIEGVYLSPSRCFDFDR